MGARDSIGAKAEKELQAVVEAAKTGTKAQLVEAANAYAFPDKGYTRATSGGQKRKLHLSAFLNLTYKVEEGQEKISEAKVRQTPAADHPEDEIAGRQSVGLRVYNTHTPEGQEKASQSKGQTKGQGQKASQGTKGKQTQAKAKETEGEENK